MTGADGTSPRPRHVLEAVLDHARNAPDRPAVSDLHADLDYGALADAVRILASGLAAHGVHPSDRVALHLPNSVDFVVSALACQYLGAVFVPLSVADPPLRLETMLADCGPALVVTSDGSDPGALPDSAHRRRQEISALSSAGAGEPLDRSPLAGGAAYVIYTSGTLGTPKGVLVGCDAFAAAVHSTVEIVGFDADTRALQVSPFHFDGSFATVFPTLYAGGRVTIRPRDALLYPRTFFNTVARGRITHTGFSPSYLRVLLSSPQVGRLADTDLEIVALGGEALSVPDIRALWQAAPQVRVFNRYGPTETTIAVSHFELTPELTAGGVAPLGLPHPGVTFHLVGEQGEIIEETGRAGELYIGGAQLMVGYWEAPDLTAAVLRDDVVPGENVYRTGDLVYRDAAGHYVYRGRVDQVVKRGGVRISLTELGEAVRAVDGVAAAACVAYDHRGRTGIAAFVVASQALDPAALWQATRTRLPESMVPDPFVLVDELPQTTSGKVDDERLLAGAGLAPAHPR